MATYCNTLNNGSANQKACGQGALDRPVCVRNQLLSLGGNSGQSCAVFHGLEQRSWGRYLECWLQRLVVGTIQQPNVQRPVSVPAGRQRVQKRLLLNSSACKRGELLVFSNICSNGGKNATLSDGGLAYTPSQIRDAYGINGLSLDGTGQTIAIVDAYDDPNIFDSLDAFDQQFSLTDSGPTLFNQYGPAASFLTVLNPNGQSSPLPATDPTGAGNDNWEVEEALDVEWIHSIAPVYWKSSWWKPTAASLSDLMASVGTAASQPGVSVVSMSWGFPEGQAVFAADEATYDATFDVPGVTFVASTGDYGTADPEPYPAYSPNVVAVGGDEPDSQLRQLVQQRNRVGLLLEFGGYVDRLRRRPQHVRDRARLPGGRAVHRQSNDARRLHGRRSGHRRVDRRHI